MSLLNSKPKAPAGRDVSGGKKGAYWVGSQYDENEKTAKFRDKKFEGYSELKSGLDPSQTLGRKQADDSGDKALRQLEDEYILNLQKQIALMEQELKLLKEREMEQNKAAAGYEVLLKDGIPVNEHFIALKNKYNVEKDNWEKKLNNQDEDNKAEIKNNKERSHRIEILNHEFEVISDRYNYFKKETTARIEDLESKIFFESNTIADLKRIKDELNSNLMALETENAQLERIIARNKMFNKKPEELKRRKDETDKRDKKMRELNEEVARLDLELLRQRMKLDDKDLIKKQNEEVLKSTQEFSRYEIEINIAKSKIKELEGVKHMNIRILQDIYAEKRDLENENKKMEAKLEKKPDSLGDAKFQEEMAIKEREKLEEFQSKLKADKEYTEILLNSLRDEEGKAKDMLDTKVRLENELKLDHEDLDRFKGTVNKNTQELIRLEDLRDILSSKKIRLTDEVTTLTQENEDYIDRNAQLEAENAELEMKIKMVKQKIDVNSLLKEINMDDLMLAAKNNRKVNQQLISMINTQENIFNQ